ncbi:hypothetical protein A1sIA53_00230 [Candidatus Planktophila dulcis]|uniref:hypothetical protein n=1 Tax=Candidatus Planktophila dulcis TaxID=1884914 RepID=UPI000BACD03C|nr:hypothetical protein [Candidatus Planktophila dulcis]ASY14023.1 hypothetical protein A1sIA53_00230 [Candidatus Planktophila dulcis]
MSTKTTFKRIALVAVAALGLGVLSVAPSSATVITHTLAIDGATDTAVAGETATAVLTQSVLTGANFDSVTVTAALTTKPTSGAATPYLNIYDSSTGDGSTPVVLSTSNFATATGSTGSASASKGVNATWTLGLYNPTVAGTYVVTVYTTPSAGGAAPAQVAAVSQIVLTWTVTVTAASTTSLGNSTATVRSGVSALSTGTLEGTDSAVVASKSATAAAAAVVWVRLKNASNTANESITAVITGNGYISASTTRGTSTALTIANGTVGSATGVGVYVFSNGTAGTATLTLSTPSLALGTKTFTFSGAAAKVAVATDPIASTIGRTTAAYNNANKFYVKVTDANGTAVAGLSAGSFVATSSNTLAVASASVGADDSDGLYPVSFVTASGATSGAKATITVKYPDPAVTTGTTYLTAVTQDVTLGGAVAKEVISFDKTSYSPGEQMIITITATDASGNPTADGRTAPALSSNKTIQGLANVATTYTGGKADSVSRDSDGSVLVSYRVYAPATSGEFKVTATGTDALATQISATATVADAAQDAATDAANEATDAANAATDAALAAADAADAATAAAQDASDAVAALSATVAKLVASLKAQITSLTNLVIKIQKKVRA